MEALDCKGTLSYLKFQPGDINGLLQLFFDNLGTVLALIAVMRFDAFAIFGVDRGIVGSDSVAAGDAYDAVVNDIVFARALPGLGFTIVFGNLYYSWMGLRLAKKKAEAGDDSPTTALPYGVNTPGAFAFLFNIILPAVIDGQFAGNCRVNDDGNYIDASNLTTIGLAPLTNDEYIACITDVAEASWRVGVSSNFIAGLVSIALGFVGNQIPKVTPVLALLTSLAGIGISFLGIGFLLQNMAEPLAGFLPLFLIFMTYFADIEFGPIPISFIVVLIGGILGWADGVLLPADLEAGTEFVQGWGAATGFEAIADFSQVGTYIGITLPVAIAAAAGTLMNVFSARRAGDDYGIAETMVSDGVGTMIGSFFGTPFGTSVYIGHPAYKKMGAGTLYSVFNCIFFFIFSLTGIFGLLGGLIPRTAIAPLLVFVGLSICKEAMEEAKPRHYPAYMFGILPDFSRWILQQGAEYSATVDNIQHFGMVAISRSSLLVALIFTATTIYMIDRRFLRATGWLVFAAILSIFSVIHQAAANIEYITELGFEPGEPDACVVGFGYCNNDERWVKATPIRFMGAYLTVAAACLLFHLGQVLPSEGSKFKIADPIFDEEEEPEFKNTMTTTAI